MTREGAAAIGVVAPSDWQEWATKMLGLRYRYPGIPWRSSGTRKLAARTCVWSVTASFVIVWSLPAAAQRTPPAHAERSAHVATTPTHRAGPTLGLEEAVGLARGGQPSVSAYQLDATASEEAALAARVLPDPTLTLGVQDFPVTGKNKFSPTADDFTMYTIGIMREQVRRSKREAEAARLRAEAVVSRLEGTAQERQIQRQVMLAWINAVEAQAKQRLLVRLIGDLKVGHQVMEAGIPTGSSTPALALQMQAEIALGEVQQADARGQEIRARAELARWIGPAANRSLPESIPALAPPAEGGGSGVDLSGHPQVRVAEAQGQAAQRQVDVARSDRRPNLSWSVTYGWRPDYGDLVSAQVSVPLQLNRSRVQNRRIAEASARVGAALLRAQDARRELGGAYGTALADYQNAQAQLAIITNRAIPSLEASFAAAEARYGAGQGSLELPLTIVRRYVETAIQAIEEQGKRARAAAELAYLTQDFAK